MDQAGVLETSLMSWVRKAGLYGGSQLRTVVVVSFVLAAEPMMRTLFLVVGILALLIGLLWIGQGTGTVNWPQSSFMIRQTQWAYYGAALAVVGVILIWRARR